MILYDKDELMRLTKQDLIEMCALLGIEVDEKWSKEKLATMISEAKETDTEKSQEPSDIEKSQEPSDTESEESVATVDNSDNLSFEAELRRRSSASTNAFSNELNRRLGRRVDKLSFEEQLAERTKRFR